MSLPSGNSKRRMAPSNVMAANGEKLPIVEPGKKPNFRGWARSGGKVSNREKSPAMGRTASAGKRLISRRFASARALSDTSIGA
jgi:hypothetical protein